MLRIRHRSGAVGHGSRSGQLAGQYCPERTAGGRRWTFCHPSVRRSDVGTVAASLLALVVVIGSAAEFLASGHRRAHYSWHRLRVDVVSAVLPVGSTAFQFAPDANMRRYLKHRDTRLIETESRL